MSFEAHAKSEMQHFRKEIVFIPKLKLHGPKTEYVRLNPSTSI
jgi:hypothetical protein